MILTLKQFSAEVGAKYGTVKRWVHEGMPVIRGGHEKKSKGGAARVRAVGRGSRNVVVTSAWDRSTARTAAL